LIPALLQFLLDHVDLRSGFRPFFRRQLAKAFQQRGDLTFLTQVINPQLLQRSAIFCRGNRSLRLRVVRGFPFTLFSSIKKGKSQALSLLSYM
jgi:hypothetical protein